MAVDSVNKCWDKFEGHLLEARNKYVPSHKLTASRGKPKPVWLTGEVRNSAKIKTKSIGGQAQPGTMKSIKVQEIALNGIFGWQLEITRKN